MELVGAYSDYQRKWIQYAWEMSNGDKNFLYMLKGENGLLSHDRMHDSSLNSVGVDWGFCGTNDYYHPHIVNNPKFLSDPEWQMRECYRMWKEGTTFYAWNRFRSEPEYRMKIKSHFKFIN